MAANRLKLATYLVALASAFSGGLTAAAGGAKNSLPDGPDSDPLPPGALARLGSARLRPGHPVSALAFTPDGKTLVSGNWGPGIHVWDVASGKELRRFAGQHHGLHVACLPDGKTVASVNTNEKVIRLWDMISGKELRRFTGHQEAIRAIACAPDGKTLASAGRAKTIRLWRVATGEQIRVLKHARDISSLAWSHDGRTLAFGAAGSVGLWDVSTGNVVREMKADMGYLSQPAWSADDRLLAVGGSHGVIQLWDPSTGGEISKLGAATGDQLRKKREKLEKMALLDKVTPSDVGYLGWIQALAFSRDGKLLYSGGQDYRTIFVLDVATGKELRRLESPQRIFCLARSADGKHLAVGGAGQQIDLWTWPPSNVLMPPRGHRGASPQWPFLPMVKSWPPPEPTRTSGCGGRAAGGNWGGCPDAIRWPAKWRQIP